ncbi:MAG: YfhO family protein [Bacteroidota bacterium]|nr:MAG: YfhO family protein [Bacteroidota bacterium]
MTTLKQNLKAFSIAVVIFLFLAMAYMAPALSGKVISQHDINMHLGMSKELVDFRNETGKEALWTNSMFGGMPAYLISTVYKSNLFRHVHSWLTLVNWRPVCFIFLYLLGFYLSLLAFKVDHRLAIVGAIMYGFSSYLLIILVPGHASKAFALGYYPAIIGGIHLAFRQKYLFGSLMAGIFLALQLLNNHLQITYYTLITILVYGLFEIIWAFKEKRLKESIKAIGMLTAMVLLAVGTSVPSLWTTAEYGKYSIRGKSELTIDQDNKTSGLDRDYATAWSYGKSETFTLMIPNFMGGASGGELPLNSATYEFLSNVQGKIEAKKTIQQMPTYWGTQPGTSGPVYVGAIVCFLFVLGIFVVDRKNRGWILTATLVSVLFSWGHNLPWLTNIMLDHLPGYNKFRAVSMTLVIAGFTMPLLAVLAFDKILKQEVNKAQALKALKYAFGITGGISFFLVLFGKSIFNFESAIDEQYLAQGYNDFVEALQTDRAMLLRRDAFRSFVFIALAAGVTYLLIQQKIKSLHAVVALGLLVLIDLWVVDKRYLNSSHFVTQKVQNQSFVPSKADVAVLTDKDPNFRVLNLAVDVFNDASTSYFHKSIGGYHGAKMRRYQELIEHNISPESQKVINALRGGNPDQIEQTLAASHVLNMLNTRYFIYNPEASPLQNVHAYGNAWFSASYLLAENADEELEKLASQGNKNNVIIDKRFSSQVENKSFVADSLARIQLESYKPNRLVYKSQSQHEQLAVFSEIYYPAGWEVSIDGKPADHFRANYVLRAMVVPAGEHSIEFVFKPRAYYTGEKISLASSVLLLLLLAGTVIFEIRMIKKESTN